MRTKKKPWVAAAKSSMATTATQNTKTALAALTSISRSSVLKMKRNGSSAVRISYMKPWTPVLIGSPREIAAAAKAASPTGGVSSARMPK